MNKETVEEEYSKALNVFGIQRNSNPFPFEPPKNVDYWADNKEVLRRIVQVHMDSMNFSSSFVYVLFGPIGGGKTFAVKYLGNPKTQKLLFESSQKTAFDIFNIRIAAIVPLRAGQLTFSLHKQIIVNCLSQILKDIELVKELKKTKDVGDGNVKIAFNDLKKSLLIYSNGSINGDAVENSQGYKFLTHSKSRIGRLIDVNELVESVKVLVNILSKKYGRIIISIDELENLAKASGTEKFLCSDFLRKMHDWIEQNLTLFLIFTFNSFEDVERLLQKAFLSRIKDNIEFPFVTNEDSVKEYVYESILQRTKINPYDIIEEDVIEEISKTLIKNFQGRLSFRLINREMHRIFASTYNLSNQSSPNKITLNMYNKAMKGITASEIVEQLTKKLNQ